MGVTFYITAHEDDWQLFRPCAAYDDLVNRDTYAVFVMTSAGDAGTLDCWWRAREQGVIASIYAALSGATKPSPPLPPSSAFTYTTTLINNKNLVKVAINFENAISTLYLLRLPDGQGFGDGFPRTGNVSMLQLFNGSGDVIEPGIDPGCQLPNDPYTTKSIQQISSLADDHGASVTYDGWQDFVDTIGAIIHSEMLGHDNATEAWINSPDWCYQCSPHDHSDHKATAYAVMQAANNLVATESYKFGRAEWPSYSVIACPKNLNDAQRNQLAIVCSAYVEAAYAFLWENYRNCEDYGKDCIGMIGCGLLGGGDYKKWPDWDVWAGWQYCRIVPLGATDTPPANCGPCGTSDGTGSEIARKLLEKEVLDAHDLARRTNR